MSGKDRQVLGGEIIKSHRHPSVRPSYLPLSYPSHSPCHGYLDSREGLLAGSGISFWE